MRTLILATRNRHKAIELQTLLEGLGHCRTLHGLSDAPELVEDADTFAANASGKAVQLADWLAGLGQEQGAWVLADDSGLEVDALQGAPGVQSARFAADEAGAPGNAPDQANNAKLLRLLARVPAGNRSARFRCCLALVAVPAPGFSAGAPVLFEGLCEGSIAFKPRGRHGFGYDPLFVPRGLDRTFAELTEAEKNRISHRRAALARLREWSRNRP